MCITFPPFHAIRFLNVTFKKQNERKQLPLFTSIWSYKSYRNYLGQAHNNEELGPKKFVTCPKLSIYLTYL